VTAGQARGNTDTDISAQLFLLSQLLHEARCEVTALARLVVPGGREDGSLTPWMMSEASTISSLYEDDEDARQLPDDDDDDWHSRTEWVSELGGEVQENVS